MQCLGRPVAKTTPIFLGLAECLKSTRIPEFRAPDSLARAKGQVLCLSVLGELDLETS